MMKAKAVKVSGRIRRRVPARGATVARKTVVAGGSHITTLKLIIVGSDPSVKGNGD